MNRVIRTLVVLISIPVFVAGCRGEENSTLENIQLDKDIILRLAQPRQIALLPFINMTGHTSAGYKAATAVLESLTRSGIASEIIFNDILVALKKRGYTWERIPDEKYALEIARDMGAGYMIYGSVEKFLTGENPGMTVSMKMLDVNTGKIIFQSSLVRSSPSAWSEVFRRRVYRTADELLREAIDEFTNMITVKYRDKFTDAGNVLLDKINVKIKGIRKMHGEKLEAAMVKKAIRHYEKLKSSPPENQVRRYRDTSKLYTMVSKLYKDIRYKNRLDYIRKKQIAAARKEKRK